MAAVLYGVGSRLDDSPELLFKLRGVDPNDLIGSALVEATDASIILPGAAQLGTASELEDIFGIDLIDEANTTEKPPEITRKTTKKKAVKKKTAKKTTKKEPASKKKVAPSPKKKKATKKKAVQRKATKKKTTAKTRSKKK